MSFRNAMAALGIGTYAKRDSLMTEEDKATMQVDADAQKAEEQAARAAQQALVETAMTTKHAAVKEDFENLKKELAAIDDLKDSYSDKATIEQFKAYLRNANEYNQIIKNYLRITPIASLKSQHAELDKAYQAFMKSSKLDLLNAQLNHANQTRSPNPTRSI